MLSIWTTSNFLSSGNELKDSASQDQTAIVVKSYRKKNVKLIVFEPLYPHKRSITLSGWV